MPMEKKENPTVTIMGENVSHNTLNRQSGDMVWGICMILIGFCLLLNFMDILPWEFWGNVWRFWPMLIILTGVSVILGSGPVARFALSVLSIFVFSFIILVGIRQTQPSLAENFPLEVSNLIEIWEEIRYER